MYNKPYTKTINISDAKHIAHKEKFSVYRKFMLGNRFVCYCDEINEKDGIFSFVDSETNTVLAIINKSEFAYATRNY